MLTPHALNTLTQALATTLILCTLTQAAPAGVSTTANEGLAATLEISRLDADFANSLPNGFSTTDTVYNAQPYASAEVDTETELAPTSLPMTNEEMALAEMAAVVAELATTTTDEMKSKTTIEDDEKLIRRRAEEAKRQAIQREIANTVESVEGEPIDEKDFLAITTFRSHFLNAIATTATPITSALLTTTTPAVTATTTFEQTTNTSPEILNELVRAAAAANEILAAALNVATMAVTNVTNATNATTTYVSSEATPTTTATTIEPIAIANSDGDAVVDDHTLPLTSDGNALPEQSVKWQAKEAAVTSLPTEIIQTSTIKTIKGDVPADTSKAAATTTETTDRDVTIKENISNGLNGDMFLVKPLEGATLTRADFQIAMTQTTNESTTSSPYVFEEFTSQNSIEVAASADTEKPIDYLKTTKDFHNFEEYHEPAESIQIIVKETTTETTPPATGDNELEQDIINQDDNNSFVSKKHRKITEILPNNVETNAIDSGTIEIAKNIILETTTPSSLPSATLTDEYSKEAVDIEKAKIEEPTQEMDQESNRGGNVKPESATTTENTMGTEDLPLTTTEPLETLIAVESEVRAPNKIAGNAEEEDRAELVPFTTALPVITRSTETVADLQKQQIAISILPADTTRTTTATIVGEIESQSVTNPEVSTLTDVNFSEADVDTEAKNLTETKMELATTIAGSNKTTADNAVNDEAERKSNAAPQPVTSATETPKTTTTDLETVGKETLEEAAAELPEYFQTESIVRMIETADLTTSSNGRTEEDATTVTYPKFSAEPITTLTAVKITNDDSTTVDPQESMASSTPTNRVQIITTREPVKSETTTENAEERVNSFEFVSNSIRVPLAPFSTTTRPTVTEELLHVTTIAKSNMEVFSGKENNGNELMRGNLSETTTTIADSMIPTTLSDSSATTNAPATYELLATQTYEGDSTISDTTTSGMVVETTTIGAVAVEAELSAITTTTVRVDTTTETIKSEQPLYMRSRNEQQYQRTAIGSDSTTDIINVETEADTTTTHAGTLEAEGRETATTRETDLSEQNHEMRELYEQKRAFESAANKETTEATTSTEFATSTEDISTTTTLITADESTTNTPTTTKTTTTTTTTPQPETTTLSPMSLIIAEHEARSLDKTPPRVSRVVNDDGVEVLSGYSIVHHMHAAALAVMGAEGA